MIGKASMDGALGRLVAAAGGVALAVGLTLGGISGAVAQQKKDAPKAAAPAAAAAPAQPQGEQVMWVKLCEKAPVLTKDKDGKDLRTEKGICLTHHERLDGNSGMVLVSAAVREIEGIEKRHLMIMVPLGMAIPPGVGAVFAKNEDGKLAVGKDEKPIRLNYTLCHAAGCTAELEITPEIMKRMQAATKDEYLVVRSINVAAKTVDFPVPMFGFADALKGEPVNNEEYAKARRQLMEIIRARQAEVIEKAQEVEKKAEEDAKAKQPAPAPAAKAPAQPKKQ